MTQIRAGMEIQEDVLKLRIENEQLKNQLDNIKANADYQIEGRDLEIKELKEQNTNLQIMLKSEREVRCNDDYLKRVCELEEELADYQFNYPTIKELSKENAELKAQIEKMKCCQNCKHLNSLAYGEFSCDLYGECKHYSKWEIKEND